MTVNSGIYGLTDPRTGVVMYVGKSIDIQTRYRQHLDSWKSVDGNMAKMKWIEELRQLRLRPGIVVLREVDRHSYVEMDAAEAEIIRSMKADGQAVLNLANGGASRATDRVLNGTKDDWMALGELLRRIREDIYTAADIAGRLSGAKYHDKVTAAVKPIDKARFDLEDLIYRKFPEWRGFIRYFLYGKDAA